MTSAIIQRQSALRHPGNAADFLAGRADGLHIFDGFSLGRECYFPDSTNIPHPISHGIFSAIPHSSTSVPFFGHRTQMFQNYTWPSLSNSNPSAASGPY